MSYTLYKSILSVLLLAAFNLNSQAQTNTGDSIIYEKADVIPSFTGGDDSLRMFIGRNMNYPRCENRQKIAGVTVKVFFVVDISGTVGNVTVPDKTIEKCYSDEAIRVVKLMSGKWTPGSINGKFVNIQCLLPLSFLR